MRRAAASPRFSRAAQAMSDFRRLYTAGREDDRYLRTLTDEPIAPR